MPILHPILSSLSTWSRYILTFIAHDVHHNKLLQWGAREAVSSSCSTEHMMARHKRPSVHGDDTNCKLSMQGASPGTQGRTAGTRDAALHDKHLWRCAERYSPAGPQDFACFVSQSRVISMLF